MIVELINKLFFFNFDRIIFYYYFIKCQRELFVVEI